jgi:uncharacterized membrane protein YjjP (DUF1212 family)
VKPWILYTLIRIGIFAVCFAVLYGLGGLQGWIAALIAAAIGLCVSYIFFRPQRDHAIRSFTARSAAGSTVTDSDESSEDEL